VEISSTTRPPVKGLPSADDHYADHDWDVDTERLPRDYGEDWVQEQPRSDRGYRDRAGNDMREVWVHCRECDDVHQHWKCIETKAQRKQRFARERKERDYRELKAAILYGLGGKCVICGSTEELEIDHIGGGDGRGNRDRRGRGGTPLYRRIRRALRNGETVKGIQLLCRPCNQRSAVAGKDPDRAAFGAFRDLRSNSAPKARTTPGLPVEPLQADTSEKIEEYHLRPTRVAARWMRRQGAEGTPKRAPNPDPDRG